MFLFEIVWNAFKKLKTFVFICDNLWFYWVNFKLIRSFSIPFGKIAVIRKHLNISQMNWFWICAQYFFTFNLICSQVCLFDWNLFFLFQSLVFLSLPSFPQNKFTLEWFFGVDSKSYVIIIILFILFVFFKHR